MEKRKTIYDIAKLADVSPASVSRAIHQPEHVSESTKQKIWNAFATLKISPEDLSFKATVKNPPHTPAAHTSNVLVCIPGFSNPFYDNILEGIQDQLRQASYNMLVYGMPLTKHNIHPFLEMASAMHPDGLIITDQLTEDILQRLNAYYPLVQCSEYNAACPKISYVTIDDYTITEKAIYHLVQKGCKNIGFFSSPYRHHYVQNRYMAYKAVLSEANLHFHPEYIMQVADFSYERILAAARRFFMADNFPDAIFAVSDKHAHALVKAALASGLRVPEDVKIIGFDDTMYATLSTPTITTIAQPRRELGAESAQILLDKIKQPKNPAVSRILPSKIIFREST